MDKITTTSVSNGFAKVEEFLLSDTPQTAIVFQPELHQGGVRGKIIRFKKNRNGERVRPVSVDFKTLKFKNVLSYGNNWTELDFHKGLNLIKAQNRKW